MKRLIPGTGRDGKDVRPVGALIPPDLKRCQAMKPNGVNFMTFGGVHRMVQCKSVPSSIVHERKPGPDGRKGSMSLCEQCLGVLEKQSPTGLAPYKVEPIKRAADPYLAGIDAKTDKIKRARKKVTR